MRPTAIGIAFLLTIALPVSAEPIEVVSKSPAQLLSTDGYVLHSRRLGRDFLVQVTKPPTANTTLGQRLAVLYALDGGLDFIAATGQFMTMVGATGPLMVVTVGYQPQDYRFRNGDVLHATVEREGVTVGGRGGLLEQFLKEDLTPFIQAHYPAADTNARFLFGHSYAAAFAVNVLANDPTAFDGYVIASPVLMHDAKAIARVAATAPRAKGVRVYLAAGGRDLPGVAESLHALKTALETSGTGVRLMTHVYETGDHASYLPSAIAEALPMLVPPSR